jgi:toxin ParE1/3/4
MNSTVDFTPESESDLADIAHYTKGKWGAAQALRYADVLDKCFVDIAEKRVLSRHLSLNSATVPAIHVCRCQHHYIFFQWRGEGIKPLILAVLYERMDLMTRLRKRLDLS